MDYLFKTNYNKSLMSHQQFKDAIEVFKVESSAHQFFPKRKLWTTTNAFSPPEYDFFETGRIIDTEALVARAFDKKVNYCFQESFKIQSNHNANLKYIKKRVSEIEYVSNFRFSKFIRELAYNLITLHNVYILKVRKENASSGKRRKWRGTGRDIAPVAGYFVLPAETVEIKCDDRGVIEKYRQNLKGNYIEFMPRDVIHLHYNRRTGVTVGTPPLEPVKDDIIALRKIEESVETMIYKCLFPIIHIKVGTEKSPARVLPDGVSEVAVATNLLRTLDDSGGIATSERVEVNMVGAESQALRVESYLAHFKQRVYSGLGMSSMDFGDITGGGTASGEFITADFKANMKAYQEEIADGITYEIFDELLLESGKYEHTFEISDEDDRVWFTFPEINVDNMLKKENHTLNKVNANLLTTTEARDELGKDPLPDDDIEQTHGMRVEKSLKKEDLKNQKDLSKHDAALVPPSTTTAVTKKAANGSSTTTKTTKTGTAKSQPTKRAGSSGAAKSKTKPKNQHSKDALIHGIYQILNNKNITAKETALVKKIADYMLFNISEGYMDPEFEDSLAIPEISQYSQRVAAHIVLDLMAIADSSIKHPVLINQRKDLLISKSIDKVSEYINNIKNLH